MGLHIKNGTFSPQMMTYGHIALILNFSKIFMRGGGGGGGAILGSLEFQVSAPFWSKIQFFEDMRGGVWGGAKIWWS